jgi:hypothetical protein
MSVIEPNGEIHNADNITDKMSLAEESVNGVEYDGLVQPNIDTTLQLSREEQEAVEKLSTTFLHKQLPHLKHAQQQLAHLKSVL